ncbi:hypothetical protein RI367_007756 [Sorochytrium milnesiophthora]
MSLPTSQPASPSAPRANPPPTIRIIPYVTETHRGLNFPIIEKKVPNGKVISVKRFVEKGNVDFSDCISFKSKVVSRQHGELWSEGSHFFFKDTKSSSGTFINNVRISPAGQESAPVQLKDGDIIQLGVDYQGRSEDVFRCVRMRVELNREAIKHRNNAFRNQVVKALRALASATDKDSAGSTGDCCICLGSIAPFQALFIAPCCHSFHFKCARPLLQNWPTFQCPLCRHFADLSSSVSVDDLGMWNDVPDDEEVSKPEVLEHAVEATGDGQPTDRPGSIDHSAANSDNEDDQDGERLVARAHQALTASPSSEPPPQDDELSSAGGSPPDVNPAARIITAEPLSPQFPSPASPTGDAEATDAEEDTQHLPPRHQQQQPAQAQEPTDANTNQNISPKLGNLSLDTPQSSAADGPADSAGHRSSEDLGRLATQ